MKINMNTEKKPDYPVRRIYKLRGMVCIRSFGKTFFKQDESGRNRRFGTLYFPQKELFRLLFIKEKVLPLTIAAAFRYFEYPFIPIKRTICIWRGKFSHHKNTSIEKRYE